MLIYFTVIVSNLICNIQATYDINRILPFSLVAEISLQNFNNELSYNFYFATAQYIFLYKVKT